MLQQLISQHEAVGWNCPIESVGSIAPAIVVAANQTFQQYQLSLQPHVDYSRPLTLPCRRGEFLRIPTGRVVDILVASWTLSYFFIASYWCGFANLCIVGLGRVFQIPPAATAPCLPVPKLSMLNQTFHEDPMHQSPPVLEMTRGPRKQRSPRGCQKKPDGQYLPSQWDAYE